jgi:uncharacterized protein (DUF433 family)
MAKERISHEDRIIQDPEIMVGKPVVRGTRIPVEVVLGKLAENTDLDDLFAAYPRLTIEDVKACLSYAQALVGKKHRRAGGTVTGVQPAHCELPSG